MAKYRLLMRPDETLNGVSWEYFNIDKYIEPPVLMIYYDLIDALVSLYTNSIDKSYFTSFKRSDTPHPIPLILQE